MLKLRSLLCLHRQASIYHVRFKSSYEEIKIPVPWGHVAGRWWGPINQRPVLTLHGWQDNCGSFNRFIPLLNPDVGFLSIDFPGHGLSSYLPSGMYYHLINYVILVQNIANYFQWPRISLMGHSMGGVVSFLYTMIHPKNVDFLICIDSLKPMIVKDIISRTHKRITSFQKYATFEQSNTEPPSYSMDEIKKKICFPNNQSISYEHSHHVAERNIAPSKSSPGKYYFTRDPRLKAGELKVWPQEEIVMLAKNITCPVFVGKAISASYYEPKENFYEVLDILKANSVDCQYHRVEGVHHVHLNNPEVIASLIKKFIEKHDQQNRF